MVVFIYRYRADIQPSMYKGDIGFQVGDTPRTVNWTEGMQVNYIFKSNRTDTWYENSKPVSTMLPKD